MSVDIDQFRHHLTGYALSADQEADIIRAVYLVMQSFADLAFGVDSTQISLGITGDTSGGGLPDALDSTSHIPSTFNDVATGYAAGKTEL